MKECELCNSPARMFCESDQASLCWECDSRVHSANFLVARHVRTLLCHACQSCTPWKASGSKLGPTVSVCVGCVGRCNQMRNDEEEADDSHGNEDEDDDDEEEEEDEDDEEDESDQEDDEEEDDADEDEDEDEDEDGDNQVVPPWSSSTPPPPIASSSSSEDSSTRFCFSGAAIRSAGAFPTKRMRESVDLGSQDDFNFSCSSSQRNSITGRNGSVRPLSDRKRALTTASSETDSKPITILNSIKGFEQKLISGRNTSAMILGMCKLSEDPSVAVDLVSTD